ncbi:hypothetical protein [Thermomonas carbonis]|uniref:Uncharacterized protein n=1 Tax=Thermomonas carbonis TaxID=1463158 RepID=A0A7G9SNE9_9GAMM|nr:hypothetical protein [Thermomonas carbonis]QNN69374.1 hypothetical protein H9L16_11910 [Thermomonas carbonis]GHC13145.1 hypothetical protein GCM10010080_30810 [Thermomonas carbonis]
MALHKKGDRYLTEEEYQSEKSFEETLGLFFLGAGLVGCLAWYLTAELELPKLLRLARWAAIVFSALIGGALFLKFSEVVRKIIGWSLLLGLLYVVWQIV